MAKGYLPTAGGKIKDLLRAGAAFIAALLLAVTAVGCVASSASPRLVDHGFAFDARLDSPGVTVLNYSYSARLAPEWALKEGRSPQFDNASLAMPVGDNLYVKWRINATGEVLEQTVDLRDRLPRDMTNHKIYFLIKQRELLIYVISPEKRPPDWPKYEPPGWIHRKVYVVYPMSTLDR
jgi:hypothetical protein